MRQELLVQAAGGSSGGRVLDLASRLVTATAPKHLGVAVAYASVSGLRSLMCLVPSVTQSAWVIGLDDMLTHPSVIDVLARLPGASLRVAGEPVNGRRFHPKMYMLSNKRAAVASLMVGSANMTSGGLSTNAEAVVALTARRSVEVLQLERYWQEAWRLGAPPTEALIEKYRRDFELAFKARKRSAIPTGPILAHDDATIDPSVATVVWIEVGNITGFRQEQLEIKAEQALFFGLPMTGGPDTVIRVRVISGKDVDIPVKYRGNAMWRFNLPESIPEVSAGLRPNGKRSPFIAVFTRAASGAVTLEFVRIGSLRGKQLISESEGRGTYGHTSARSYGWY